MTIAFDALLRVARQVDEDAFESTATNGSATTLVDTSNVESNDFWNNGTLFFKNGNRGSTTALITDFAAGGTFTFATGLACAAGNTYLALTPAWPRGQLVRAVNTALMKQLILTENETTAVVSGQLDYTLPTGVSNLTHVFTGTDTDGWKENNTWHERNGELTFYANAPTDGYIRMVYAGNHTTLSADSSTINSQIDIDLLVLDALAELWLQRSERNDENPRAKDRFAYYFNEAEKVRMRKAPITRAPRYSGY